MPEILYSNTYNAACDLGGAFGFFGGYGGDTGACRNELASNVLGASDPINIPVVPGQELRIWGVALNTTGTFRSFRLRWYAANGTTVVSDAFTGSVNNDAPVPFDHTVTVPANAAILRALSNAPVGYGQLHISRESQIDEELEGSDTGSGAEEAEDPPEIVLSGTDSGSGAEDASVFPYESAPDAGDTGSGTEGATLVVELTASDSGRAVEAVAGSDKEPQTASEVAVGVDTAYVTKMPTITPGYSGSPGGGTPNTPPTVAEFLYDEIDITGDVLFDSVRFTTAANGTPGTATLRVRDFGHTVRLVTGRSLQLKINDVVEWDGYVSGVRRGYFLRDAKDPSTRERYFQIDGLDVNILLQRRHLRDKADPTIVQLTSFSPGTADDVVIKRYMVDHLDLNGDRLTDALIEHVGTPSVDSEISGAASWSWNDFMQMMTRNTGAIYYIDPERNVVLTDVDTPNAPFGISDAPIAGEVGCRELEVMFDATKMTNDALIWGAGQGADIVRFKRTQDEASITEHNRWQAGQFNAGVWRQETVDRIADSYVYGSPQNKRGGKDDAIAARCYLFTPGLRVGMKVPVRSMVFGFEDTLPIRQMEIDFIEKQPRWNLLLSHEVDPPWSTHEFWMPSFGLPDFSPPDFMIPGFPSIGLPSLPPWCPCCDGGVDRLPVVGMMGLGWVNCTYEPPMSVVHWGFEGTKWDDTGQYPSDNGGLTARGDIQGGCMVNSGVASGPMGGGPVPMAPETEFIFRAAIIDERPEYGGVSVRIRWHEGPLSNDTKLKEDVFGPGESGGDMHSISPPAVSPHTVVWMRWNVYRPSQSTRIRLCDFNVLSAGGAADPRCPPDSPTILGMPDNGDEVRELTAVWLNGELAVEGVHYERCGLHNNYVCPLIEIDEEDVWEMSYEPLGICDFDTPVASDPSGGEVGEPGVRESIDEDGDTWVRVGVQYEPRTTRVWVDGALLRRSIDYVEHPTQGMVEILVHVGLGASNVIWVSYVERAVSILNPPEPL